MTTKKKMSKGKKVGITISAIVGVAALTGVGYVIYQNIANGDPNMGYYQNPEGHETTVMRGMVESTITGRGMTSAKERKVLGEDLKGEVLDVHVKTGDKVLAGDLLMSVDPSVLRDELNAALDELDTATKALSDIHENIQNLNVYAPFTGKIIKVTEANVGSKVADTTFATIVDDSVMKFEGFYSYGYIDTIKEGQTAMVSIPATTSTLEGTVSLVEDVRKISETSGAVMFKVVIDVKNPGTLTEDMIATAVINTPSGEVMPAEQGVLKYSKTQDILLEVSSNAIYEDIRASEYYTYNAGDVLATLSDDSIDDTLKSAEREVEAKQETVDEKTKALEDAELRATFDGIVSSISVVAGDELLGGEGQNPISVANLDELYIDIEISEYDITKAQMDMPVEITYQTTEGEMFFVSGIISALSLEAKESSDQYGSFLTMFPAKIKISEPGELRPDMNVEYRMVASQKMDVLTVPVSAVIQTDNGPVIYVKDGDYSVETYPVIDETIPAGYVGYPVEVGISDGYNSEIIADTEIENATIYVPYSTATQEGMDPWGYGGGVVYESEVYYG